MEKCPEGVTQRGCANREALVSDSRACLSHCAEKLTLRFVLTLQVEFF